MISVPDTASPRPRASRITAAVVLLGVFSAGAARAEGDLLWAGYLGFTTDRVVRGLSWTAGRPSAQIGGEVEWQREWFAGFYLANVDYVESPRNPLDRHVELDVYAGYRKAYDNFAWDATVVRYNYPGDSRYDYYEGSVGIHYLDKYSLLVNRSFEALSPLDAGGSVEFRASHHATGRLSFTGGVGYRHYKRQSWDFVYADAGVALLLGPVTLDLRAYTTFDEDDYFYTSQAGGDRIVFSITFGGN